MDILGVLVPWGWRQIGQGAAVVQHLCDVTCDVIGSDWHKCAHYILHVAGLANGLDKRLVLLPPQRLPRLSLGHVMDMEHNIATKSPSRVPRRS